VPVQPRVEVEVGVPDECEGPQRVES
jgi:hypothetical protein